MRQLTDLDVQVELYIILVRQPTDLDVRIELLLKINNSKRKTYYLMKLNTKGCVSTLDLVCQRLL